MRKPRTLAGELIKAGEKAQRAAHKVRAAEQALNNARKAQAKIDAQYLQLVRQTVDRAPAPQEGGAASLQA